MLLAFFVSHFFNLIIKKLQKKLGGKMKSHARVVVIGGGVVGLGTLYHLAKKGCTESILIERKELTSGSTWHAAGLLPLFNMSYSVGQIHRYSVEFYKNLASETGQDVGFKQVGNIRLATNEDRLDEYQQYAGVASTIGVEVSFLTPSEVKDLWPFCNTNGIIGGIIHKKDGYIQPADLTQAMAIGARNLGAKIYRQTAVEKITLLPSGEWKVVTDKGSVTCEHVVTATGNFARQTGDMVRLNVPVIPVEHQYIVTEPHPEIQTRNEHGLVELPVLRDSDSSWYMREESGGLILGPYESGAPCCYINGPSKNSEFELFQEDLERLEPHIIAAIDRVPIFGEVGVKKVYNGAICYTPDGNPIIGPAWDLKNFWLNEGHSFGITAAGGAGWQLAEWILEGAPTIDMLGVDPRRYGPYTSKSYLKAKNEEAYANVFVIHYPDEERPAGRPLKTSPCYERMNQLGAVFGQKYGWERPNWFAPKGVKQIDHWSFRRSKWFKHVGNECKNVTKNVGILDMTPFAKCYISGPNSEAWLSNLLANRLPSVGGKIKLCHALNQNGGVRSEFTVLRNSDKSFYLVSAGALERFDHDYIRKNLPKDGSVRYENVTNRIGVLVIAGPKSRTLMSRLTDLDVSNKSFPWLSAKIGDIGFSECSIIRVNFVGELGWEIHHPIEQQNNIFDHIMHAGKDLNLKPFGIRALDSLRLEKSYRLIGTELSIEYAAFESGLHRFIDLGKGDFIGRTALLNWQKAGLSYSLATLEIHKTKYADAIGSNPIFYNGENVGRVTSGGFGFRLNKSLALAMLKPEFSQIGTELKVNILGVVYDATVIKNSPYDPENLKLKS